MASVRAQPLILCLGLALLRVCLAGQMDTVIFQNVGSSCTYNDVVDMKLGSGLSCPYGSGLSTDACIKSPKSITGPLAPFNEEFSLIFQGPMVISSVEIWGGKGSSLISSWSASGGSHNLVWLNNLGSVLPGNSGTWDACHGGSQSYASSDGASNSAAPAEFGGKLAEGVIVNVMQNIGCDNSCGFARPGGVNKKGWVLSDVVIKVEAYFPGSSGTPTVWVQNAKTLRTNQFGCNCRGVGSPGGCGEHDIVEVIPGQSDQMRPQLYSCKGTFISPVFDYFRRPTSSPAAIVTIYDTCTNSIRTLMLDGPAAVSPSAVSGWMQKPGSTADFASIGVTSPGVCTGVTAGSGASSSATSSDSGGSSSATSSSSGGSSSATSSGSGGSSSTTSSGTGGSSSTTSSRSGSTAASSSSTSSATGGSSAPPATVFGVCVDDASLKSVTAPMLSEFGAVKFYQGVGTSLIGLAAGKAVSIQVPSTDVPAIAASLSAAQGFVASHIVPFGSSIKTLHVGNELLASWEGSTYYSSIGPALKNIWTALANAGVIGVRVSTPMDMSVFVNTYPASAAEVSSSVSGPMGELLSFLSSTGNPFTVNIYPHVACEADSRIPLNFCLGSSGASPIGGSPNMFFANLNAAAAALKKLGFTGTIEVGETGWPTGGSPLASLTNAAAYFNNLKGYSGLPPLVHWFEIMDVPGKVDAFGAAGATLGVYDSNGNKKQDFS